MCNPERVHRERLQQFLFIWLTDREVVLAVEMFISRKGRRRNWSFSVRSHSEDCIGLPRVTSGSFVSEAIPKTALARLEQPLKVSFCRNRDRMKRASSSSGDAATGAGSARAAATRTNTARVLEQGREEGGHSIDCIALPSRASASCAEPIQTVKWCGGGCGWKQGLAREVTRHNRVRWQWTSSVFPFQWI